jgi:hypothetical protein
MRWLTVPMLSLSLLAPGLAQAAPHEDVVHRWNHIALDATGLDHLSPPLADQLGPGRSSRAMAIVHIAMFDALNAIIGGYESYTGTPRTGRGTSQDAAAAQAAHDTLVALFPAQRSTLDNLLSEELARPPHGRPKLDGIALGQQVAAALLAMRAEDGSDHEEPVVGEDHITSNDPGHWRQDPISQIPLALGAHWGTCAPFVMQTPDQFRTPPPPAMGSPEYTAAYNDVKAIGGDGDITPTSRTEEQTQIGIFWAYDGTPNLCAPPRLYNQIVLQIADERRTRMFETARLLALLNTALADSGIAIWESKYFYDFWRPITGIRESDPGTGPTGNGDGNDDTMGDIDFSPLGAPASNSLSPNFTPPFPAYPSGHAGFGGATFQVLRRFYGTDDIAFTFISDELNGVTLDNQGMPRPLVPRSFSTLSEAEEENGQSRIYLGIHWAFDKTEGITQGRDVADYVFDNAFQPEP